MPWREGYSPVKRLITLGMVQGAAAKALETSTPEAARRSMQGEVGRRYP
jgi:hypothetical protein